MFLHDGTKTDKELDVARTYLLGMIAEADAEDDQASLRAMVAYCDVVKAAGVLVNGMKTLEDAQEAIKRLNAACAILQGTGPEANTNA